MAGVGGGDGGERSVVNLLSQWSLPGSQEGNCLSHQSYYEFLTKPMLLGLVPGSETRLDFYLTLVVNS